jgi:hypothetical protein
MMASAIADSTSSWCRSATRCWLPTNLIASWPPGVFRVRWTFAGNSANDLGVAWTPRLMFACRIWAAPAGTAFPLT